jgi:acylphosphatase
VGDLFLSRAKKRIALVWGVEMMAMNNMKAHVMISGRAEAVFEGSTEDVEEMIRWCRLGPSEARFEDVDVSRQKYMGELDSFLRLILVLSSMRVFPPWQYYVSYT